MPFQNPNLRPNPSRRQLQRGLDNITLTTRPGSGIIAAKTGNHYQISTRRVHGGRGGSGLILVRIDENATLFSKTIQWGNTGTAASEAVAWKYGGVECRLDTSSPDGSVVAVDGGMTWDAGGTVGTATPPIFNPHEFSATTTIVGGVLVDADSYPATAGDATTHRFRPLDAAGTSNAHAWTPIVWVTTSVNSDGETIWVVVSPRNQHDGNCG